MITATLVTVDTAGDFSLTHEDMTINAGKHLKHKNKSELIDFTVSYQNHCMFWCFSFFQMSLMRHIYAVLLVTFLVLK